MPAQSRLAAPPSPMKMGEGRDGGIAAIGIAPFPTFPRFQGKEQNGESQINRAKYEALHYPCIRNNRAASSSRVSSISRITLSMSTAFNLRSNFPVSSTSGVNVPAS